MHNTTGAAWRKDLNLLKWLRKHLLFVLVVILPTLISGAYFGLIASDVYISESRFVVRTAQKQQISSIGSLLQGSGLSGFTRAQDDAYTVSSFIQSRDASAFVDSELNVRALFSNENIDRLSRFPTLPTFDDSFEGLHKYFQGKVEVRLDPTSSISTLVVKAFEASDAQRINDVLLKRAESLVNGLNQRAREDLIRHAKLEVEASEARVKEAAVALSRFRNQNEVVDPERQSGLQLQQILKVQDELLATKSQLAQLRLLAPDNPQITALEVKREALEREIDRELRNITGANKSLSSKAVEFQRLALEREFAERQLAAALVALEQAKNEAQRKQLYLERIAEPNLPDIALEPERLRAVVATFIVGMIAWGVLVILLAGIREHND